MIVFMGTPAFAVPILQMLIDHNYPVGLVVTQPDRKSGRKQQLIASPVKMLALKYGIPVFQPEKLRDAYQYIVDLKPTMLMTAAYGQILPKGLLACAKAYNMHGSLLPKYRGGAPIQYALFDNEPKTGVTLMEMIYKMDAGNMIDTAEVDITDTDNYETLSQKLSIAGAQLLEKWMPKLLAETYESIVQDESKVTFAYTLKYEDELINWQQTADQIVGRIKGLSPNLGGTACIDEQIIKIYKAQKSDIINSGTPGLVLIENKKLYVRAHDAWVEVLEIKQQGKKQMDTKSFLNGQNLLKSGDYFKLKEDMKDV